MHLLIKKQFDPVGKNPDFEVGLPDADLSSASYWVWDYKQTWLL